MKQYRVEKEFYLEVVLSQRIVEIKVLVEGEWFNDGIGFYEYGSLKCIDKGQDYFKIESHSWDNTGFSEEEIRMIETAIESNIKNWESEIESISFAEDFHDFEDEY
jgi:hypothetical protein